MARAVVTTLLVFTLACGDSAPEPPATPVGTGTESGVSGLQTQTFEQNFVFASVSGDSLFLVPWLIRSTSRPDGILREARGWLARSGTWDAFYSQEWNTPPSRAPARFLPHGNLQLLVQEGDVVDGIIFDDGTRSLELVLGDARASWSGPLGETVDVLEGAAYLAEERIDGVILHLARASAGADPPGGDWGLLLSGDSARFVLAADTEHGGDVEPVYRGWGDLGSIQHQWPELHVEWTATQAFPPARRDVPASWRLWSDDGSIGGELRAVSSVMQAGVGPGPLLPVRALFEVVGEMDTAEGDFVIRGLMVHERR
jgi:hypothetical protein